MSNLRVAVVGGGAAGMLAAGRAASLGADVTLFERNERVGRKLRITGKGRCNVVNNCSPSEFLENVPGNPRFLYTAMAAFPPSEIMAFFESLGVRLKTERGNRVFPESDSATEIVDALASFCRKNSVKMRCSSRITGIFGDENGGFTVTDGSGSYEFDRVIVATGGLSYPLTGSEGDGYGFAEDFGIKVTPLRASLVPLEAEHELCASMMGLSLKNVTLKIKDEKNKQVFFEQGEMLFTHFGISGPLVLSASSHMNFDKHTYTAEIDMKPALDDKTLDTRILSDFEKYQNKDLINALTDLIPLKMIEPLIIKAVLDPRKKVNSVSKEERRRLLDTVKRFSIKINGTRPIREAIITAGGVSVKALDPKTMEAKEHPGLYFAGEIIDCDGYTGGFNLGIAFSTAYLAGSSAAGKPFEKEN